MNWQRIQAICTKEWRLNFRFPIEYIFANIMGPLKTSVFMFFLYSGLLKGTSLSIGKLNSSNFQLFVLLGTTCHSLVSFSSGVFRQRMSTERWWQTTTATFIAPVSMNEVMIAYILGGCFVQLLISLVVVTALAIFCSTPLFAVLSTAYILTALMLFTFGLGVIGGTVLLCWEGYNWIWEYGMQALLFLSCFYYPIEIFPKWLHPLIQALPTYQMNRMVRLCFMGQAQVGDLVQVGYFTLLAILFVIVPGRLFDFSIRQYGITGY